MADSKAGYLHGINYVRMEDITDIEYHRIRAGNCTLFLEGMAAALPDPSALDEVRMVMMDACRVADGWIKLKEEKNGKN